MSWPKHCQLRSGSVRIVREQNGGRLQFAKRQNRHDPLYRQKVIAQAHRLEDEERRAKAENSVSGAPPMIQPLRGVRRQGETNLAICVCNTYLGTSRRSLAKLHKRLQYDYEHGLMARVPTLDTLKSWSRRYEWQARACLFDADSNITIQQEVDFWRQDDIVKAVRRLIAERQDLEKGNQGK